MSLAIQWGPLIVWSGALEPAQHVDTGRRCQLCSTEIQLSDGQNIFVGDDTYKHLKFLFLNEEKGFMFIKDVSSKD